MAEDAHILDLMFELGQLKRISRSGWRLAGIDCPESVADHNSRTIQIGYLLALMEGYEDPGEVCAILAFHEIAECRICDIDKVANRYVDYDEEEILEDQVRPLGDMGKEIVALTRKILRKDCRAGIIAKDADFLETALTAKEYLEKGYDTKPWIKNSLGRLQTRSAIRLGQALPEVSSTDWWQGLKKL
ncbi:MAG: HD domain-containing protein [Candidatus Aenigmarchaeota archaeon]|nr:HD domain-containing protein [Candidatus Aenigmarchaeota archaeon]